MSEEKQLTEIEKAIQWTVGTVLGQASIPIMKDNKEFNEKVYTPLNNLMWDPYFENTAQQSTQFNLLKYLEKGLGGPKNEFEKNAVKILEQVLEDSQAVSTNFSDNEEENAFARETLQSIPSLLSMTINVVNGTTENFPPEVRDFNSSQPPY